MTQAFKDQMIGATRLVRSGKTRRSDSLVAAHAARSTTAERTRLSGHARADLAPPDTVDQLRPPRLQPCLETAGRVVERKRRSTSSPPSKAWASTLSLKARPSLIPKATLTAGPSFSKHFDSPAGSRPYKLYVPAVYDGAALPLVVMLHGCTQSPDDFAAGTRMNLLAEEQGFLVCYPAQTSSANSSKCWNWFNAGDQQRDRGEPSIIAGHHPRGDGAICRRSGPGLCGGPVGRRGAGRHDGAGLSRSLRRGRGSLGPGLRGRDRHVLGLPGHAAGLGSTAVLAKTTVPAVPTIVFHGDRDTTVNPVNGDEVAAQILKGEALRTEVEDGVVPHGHGFRRTRYLDRNGRAVVEQWNIHGAGHAWAGGSSAGSYTDPQGPDASREMLRFFADHVGRRTAWLNDVSALNQAASSLRWEGSETPCDVVHVMRRRSGLRRERVGVSERRWRRASNISTPASTMTSTTEKLVARVTDRG